MKPSVIVTTTPEVYFLNLESGAIKPFLANVPPPDNFFANIYKEKSNIKGIEWYPTGRHHYGICGNVDKVYISTDEFPSKILQSDKYGNVTKCFACPVHRTPPNRIHQMIFYQDKILAVSPTSDALFRLSVDSNAWEMMPMSGGGFSKIPKWDCIHPNSINCINEEIIIVCMRSESSNKISSVFSFNNESLNLLKEFDIGFHAHTVFPLGDDIFVLDSMGCCLVSLSASRKIKIDCPFDYYLKGVGVTDNFIVVGGISINNRKDRKNSEGILILMDLSGKIIDLFFLDYGVNDLRIVNQPDYGNCGNTISVVK